MSPDRVFVSLTHGKSTDCRLANASLKERLVHYNFDAYLTERTCFRCPNDECNISYLFILHRREFLRLKSYVRFETRPTFVVHTSFKELFTLDKKLRDVAIQMNSFGAQVCPQTANIGVNACPESRVLYVQTDFMVGKHDNGNQTENAVVTEMGCQADFEPENTVAIVATAPEASLIDKPVEPILDNNDNVTSDQNVQAVSAVFPTAIYHSPLHDHSYAAQPEESPMHSQEIEPTTPPIRSLEVQQDDDNDDVVFIETRPRNRIAAPLREVKVEVQEEQQKEPVPAQQPVEPVPENAVKEEPAEQEPAVAVKTSVSSVDNISNELSSASLVTPKSCSSRSSIFEGSAKRMKFSDVEMCDMCLDVTHFSSLDEYCVHVMEVHITMYRFKCKACAMRFSTFQHATRHVPMHIIPEKDNQPTVEQLIAKEIPEEHMTKFVKTALQCYPEKFRNIPAGKFLDIVRKLP